MAAKILCRMPEQMPGGVEGYKARAKAQTFAWASGNPYHERINDECCPDFSCCFPNLFNTDSAKRWEQYRAKYGSAF